MLRSSIKKILNFGKIKTEEFLGRVLKKRRHKFIIRNKTHHCVICRDVFDLDLDKEHLSFWDTYSCPGYFYEDPKGIVL